MSLKQKSQVLSLPQTDMEGLTTEPEWVFPYEYMKIGDSFFIPLQEGKKITSLQCQLLSNAKSFAFHNKKDW